MAVFTTEVVGEGLGMWQEKVQCFLFSFGRGGLLQGTTQGLWLAGPTVLHKHFWLYQEEKGTWEPGVVVFCSDQPGVSSWSLEELCKNSKKE